MIVKTDIPSIPAGCLIHYEAEGAANIVYRITFRLPTPEPSVLEDYGDGTPPPSAITPQDDADLCDPVDRSVFDEKLLRLRKNLSTAPTYIVSQEHFVRLFNPLFEPHQLVQQQLVRLSPPTLISSLNRELREWENTGSSLFSQAPRLAKRQGTLLANDEYGLLITNMLSDENHRTIEFKPKWLLQSLSAPTNSKRCRQCALVARKNAAHAQTGKDLLKTFCSLDLVSGNWDDALRVATILLAPTPGPPSPSGTNILPGKASHLLARWIHTTSLLRRLRDHQAALDTIGPLTADTSSENFRAAMTLRDVTVYLRYPAHIEDEKDGLTDPADIEARLGDLDIKSPAKAEEWSHRERLLISEGWYTGTEAEEDRQPLCCALYR